MSISINDEFTDDQASETSLDAPPGSWEPQPSRRGLLKANVASISVSSGSLHISVTNNDPSSSATLKYEFSPFSPSTQDFSDIATVTLTKTGASGFSSISLTISNASSQSHTENSSFSGDDATWNLQTQFAPSMSLTNVNEFFFTFTQPLSGTSTVEILRLSSTLVCLAPDTKILMENGEEKNIQDIKRGENIRVNNVIHKVAKVNTLQVGKYQLLDIAEVEPNSFGEGKPHTKLIISGNHPIVFRNARRPIKCLKNIKGVKYYPSPSGKKRANEILKPDENGKYYLYDLQFDHDGTYIANGVEVQSRSPYSDITPLSRELYFDESFYKDIKVWDSYSHSLPLDQTILDK